MKYNIQKAPLNDACSVLELAKNLVTLFEVKDEWWTHLPALDVE